VIYVVVRHEGVKIYILYQYYIYYSSIISNQASTNILRCNSFEDGDEKLSKIILRSESILIVTVEFDFLLKKS